MSKFTGFTRNEILVIVAILAAVWGLALPNFRQAKLSARDVQRKNDLKHIASALNDYQKNYSSYPASTNGKILGCGQPDVPRACQWGQDSLIGAKSPLSEDPLAPPKGYSYVYVSDTKNFQLFAFLENKNDPEYNPALAALKLACGRGECNFGITSSAKEAPLTRVLETGAYEGR